MTNRMKEKDFKVRTSLFPYIRAIFDRRNISYKVKYTNKEFSTITTTVSGEYFHKVVIRALCEQSDRQKEGLVVETPRVHPTEVECSQVMKEVNSRCFRILNIDYLRKCKHADMKRKKLSKSI